MRKANLIKSVFCAFTLLLLASCDKISEPYVIRNQPVDTSACPAPQFPAVTAHFKRALLEDYTGHDCPNCPRAALIASDLKKQYNDSLVVMAVHAGFFARVNAGSALLAYDFRTVAGNEWDELFNISAVGNPNGMVNRIGFPENQQVISPSAWANAVKNTISQAPLLDLQIITEYNAGEDKLCVHTKTSFIKPVSGRSLNLSVVMLEDSIIAPQKNSDPLAGATPTINDYVHMHVLRGTVNCTYGTPVLLRENISSTPIIMSFPMHFEEFNINPMIPKNCLVVAFVYDVDTKEVLQVAEARVIK